MGEVFKARDVRLDRIVAVKVSNEQFSERFDREARAVASLNHSNICTLLDVGPNYLVMEYLEGTTLKGPLPLDQALNYAAQLCDALDAAHRKGITHRDLKPANILVTKTGIKLLDFGIAKFGAAAIAAAAEGPDATLTMALTGRNEIVGTLYYMSPEQLQSQGNGQEIDARSDIFSFGLVLYEMLTGKRAFEGSTPASVIAAIMERPAPSVGKLAPAALDRALKKCLEKDPDERWQTAYDLKDELVWIAGTLNQAVPIAASTSRPRLAWITAAFLAIAVAVLSVILIRRQPELHQPIRFEIPRPAAWQVFGVPVLSPNGEWIVTSALAGSGAPELWLRPLNGLQMQPIPGTEDGTRPFWSPDSRSIAFIAARKLKRLDLASGLTQTLCEVGQPVTSGSWNRNGVILLGAYSGAIERVAAEGGELRPITTLDARRGDSGHSYPVFLPDQRRFLYHVDGKEPTLRIASLDGSEEATLPISSPTVAYAPPGYLLYTRENTVMARRFDPAGHTLTGEAFPVAEQVATGPDGAAGFSVSTNGILAWRKGTAAGLTQLTWFDRSGNVIGKVGEPADYTNPVLSPDERHLAVCVRDPQNKKRDIWLFDLVRGSSSKFTFDPADDTNPVWSPDGAKIAFSSDRKGHRDLYWKNSNGTGEDELMFGSTVDKSAEHWSPDGNFLLFNAQAVSGMSRADIMMLALPPRADSQPQTVIASPANEQRAEVSPDGKFLLYYSNATGRYEAYVQNFPPAGGKWQVSRAGASDPHWSGNKEIVYLEQNRLMATPVHSDGASFESGAPKRLFEVGVLPTGGRNSIAVSHDGKRFLINMMAIEGANAAPFTVLVNWTTGLKH
jgi:serine/threonine protein kinase